MKNTFYILIILIGVTSCNKHDHFRVSGKIKDAKGEMLYFEHNALLKTTVLDSTKLDQDGYYSFRGARPAFPDFYRLRLSEKIITFAVDSCENISIDARFENFATDYRVSGSETSKQIQKLRQSLMKIQQKVNAVKPGLSTSEENDKIADIEKDIEIHKAMARKMILQNPRSLAAYFAIYQKINDTYLFSPYIKADKPFCAAVATSFNAFMPDYARTKNLYNTVLDAIKTERQSKQNEIWKEIIAKQGVGFIDIALPDKNNQERKLSGLMGKVILVDFSAFEMKGSVDYTFALRDLYTKFHKRGFEIFQISLDQNRPLWEQSTQNIPWICVRDENGPSTKYIQSYNISSIPTTFLINRKGIIIGRSFGFDELAKVIEKNL